MATASSAADGFFRCIYEGCLSGCDSDIERRPYHRNCGCALHSKSNNKSRNCPSNSHKYKNVSYPMRRAWSEGSLVLAASNASNSCFSSPSSSPAVELPGRPQLGTTPCIEEDDDHEDISLFKV